MLDNKNVVKRHIGTFLRLGKYIDFSNHRQLINEEIASKLNKWKPLIRRHRHDVDSSDFPIFSLLLIKTFPFSHDYF
jgi:hypothetical protein